MTRIRHLSSWGLAALGCLVATGAPAQSADSHFYGGLSIGQSRARIDEPRINAGLLAAGLTPVGMSRDEHDTAFKLSGGYQFNRHIGLEGGYFKLGEFGFASTTVPAGTLEGRIRLQGMNLDLVGTWPLTDRFALIGRVGAQYAQARVRYVGSGAVAVSDPDPRKSEVNPKVGLGLQVTVSPALLLRAEAERYRINDAVGNHGGVNVFSLSLVIPFGRAAP